MDFAYSPKVQELRERVTAFMDAYVYPAEPVFERQVSEGDRWQPTAIMEELKAKAKAEGLWNLVLPAVHGENGGAGLTNQQYAPIAEITGWSTRTRPSSSPPGPRRPSTVASQTRTAWGSPRR